MDFKHRIKNDFENIIRMANAKPMIEGSNLIYGYMLGVLTGLSEDDDNNQKETDVLSSDT